MDIFSIITKLAIKLSSLDDYKKSDGYDVIILEDYEAYIDGVLIFISGKIYYTWDICAGDYPYTPSTSDRIFDSAELEVTFFVDNENEVGVKFNDEQLSVLYNQLG